MSLKNLKKLFISLGIFAVLSIPYVWIIDDSGGISAFFNLICGFILIYSGIKLDFFIEKRPKVLITILYLISLIELGFALFQNYIFIMIIVTSFVLYSNFCIIKLAGQANSLSSFTALSVIKILYQLISSILLIGMFLATSYRLFRIYILNDINSEPFFDGFLILTFLTFFAIGGLFLLKYLYKKSSIMISTYYTRSIKLTYIQIGIMGLLFLWFYFFAVSLIGATQSVDYSNMPNNYIVIIDACFIFVILVNMALALNKKNQLKSNEPFVK